MTHLQRIGLMAFIIGVGAFFSETPAEISLAIKHTLTYALLFFGAIGVLSK